MDPDISRDTLHKQLNEEWLTNIEKQLNSHLEQDAQKLTDILQMAADKIKKGEEEKAFSDLLLKLKPEKKFSDQEEEKTDSEENFEISWLKNINELTESIPEEVELVQEEGRFLPNKEDPVLIRFNKFFKRAWRGYLAGLSKLTGSSKQDAFLRWKQEVPARAIVKYYFLDFNEWVKNWDNNFRKIECDVLLEVEARILHSNELFIRLKKENEEQDEEAENPKSEQERIAIPDEQDIEIFFDKAIEEVNRVVNEHKDSLKRIIEKKRKQIVGAFSVAGTIEDRGVDLSKAQINKKENEINQNTKSRVENWNKLKLALADKLNLSKEFIKLYEQVKERIGDFSDSLAKFFDLKLSTPLNELGDLLDETIRLFEENENEGNTSEDLSKKRNEKKKQIEAFIQSKLINPISEFTKEAELSHMFDRFTSGIQEWAEDVPDKAVLVERLDLGDFPPQFEFEEVEWKSLVKRVLSNQISNVFVPKEIKPEQFLVQISNNISELNQIVVTNLEIAGEVKKSDDENPVEVAKEGLIRAQNKLNEIADSVTNRRSDLVNKLAGQQKIAFTKLANLLDKQDVSDLKLAGAQYKAKEAAVDWKLKFQARWARFVDRVELLYRFCHKKISHYFEITREFLGFSKKPELEATKVDLATFLSETDEKIAKLPFIYRRLFDFQKEVDTRFYIRRPNQFENLRKGYELWQNNFPSSFAVIGEKGSGKSLFINMIKEEILNKHDIIEVKFEGNMADKKLIIEQIASVLKISDVEETKDLIDAIKRKKKRVIVVLENIQDCYLRSIGGFEGIEELLYVISETNKEILWVASCTRYGWLFLDKVLTISNYFTHASESDNLSSDQIQDLILRRHNASGYDLEFLPDQSVKKSRSFKKNMDDAKKTQEYLRNTYFEKLSKLSEGNPSTAMIYWIRSIKEFDDTHFYINPFNFSSIDRIENLDSSDLFALTAFILHDSLYPEDLSKIMHQPLRESKLTVSRLFSNSILVEVNEGYMLNHLIYRQVVRVLKEANFIH